jgi:hypothetical protein
MSVLSQIRRLLRLPLQPVYKRVSSNGIRPSETTTPPDDDDGDSDIYEADEVAHGGFVYCAFLSLGRLFDFYF